MYVYSEALCKMNIIIPLCGLGERFSRQGYTEPKPFIKVVGKPMLEYVLDNLNKDPLDQVFIIYPERLADGLRRHILPKYPLVKIIPIDRQTKGAAETLYLGIKHIIQENPNDFRKKVLVVDCDTFYTEDIVEIFRESNCNVVFYTKNTDPSPIYSYIEMAEENGRIMTVQEKVKISDNANTGAYAFTDIDVLSKYCKHVLDSDITFKGEPYTSCVISEMLRAGITFEGRLLSTDHVYSLGTPEAVEQYIERTHVFLFDLDGTLVITDAIYYDVWHEILATYNILLTQEIFKGIIQGNNDKYVMNALLVNVDVGLQRLSEWKDRLFLQNINKLEIVQGAREAIQKIRQEGHLLAIVTNCNRLVAETIIRHINIDCWVDFVISADECPNGKITSQPYKMAIDRYQIKSNRCIIFEDSKTGILSAKGVEPKCLVGLRTIYQEDELLKYGANMSIVDFNDFDIDRFLFAKQDKCSGMLTAIKNIPIAREVFIDDAKLKGGFIADVISVRIETIYKQVIDAVVKYEAEQDNNLSSMARRLKLYEREYYFYTHMHPIVKIHIPYFHCLIQNENGQANGIVLDNLLLRGFRLNLNLNMESVDVTLKIVDRMAKLHSQFWGKPLKKQFPALHKYSDELFCPFFCDFISERAEAFKTRWYKTLNSSQRIICEEIFREFGNIQCRFSEDTNLTFIHGDIKSPNIFYDIKNDCEPWFIDWQHCCIGKGVQDLVFFIIESFDIANVKSMFQLTKEYYYRKLVEYGVTKYNREEYTRDLDDALRFIPFFTSVWFGTTPQDELIDKNFPYFLITKLFYLLDSGAL